jgi:hypothetical protein
MIEYCPDRRSEDQRVFDAAEPVLLRALGSGRITPAAYRSAVDAIKPKNDGDFSRRLRILELLEGV